MAAKAEAAIQGNPQIFVVQHNWADAFANASKEQISTDNPLPYPSCIFEFQISSRRVCVVAITDEGRVCFQIFVRDNSGWICLGRSDLAVMHLVTAQIRAIAVALEANIAAADLIVVPKKLAMARQRRGKSALPDYRVVNLARRGDGACKKANDSTEPSRNSPRMHFRRGHWRHHETRNTWIRWTLVGDPDLGFIEKHYRL